MNTKAKQFCKEVFLEYAKHIIGAYKEVIATYGIISKVGYQLNGKVFNKRFETEIEKHCTEEGINVTIWLGDTYNMGYKDLEIMLQNRSFNGGNTWIYFDSDVYYKRLHNCNKAFVDDNGRIIGKKVEETCNEYVTNCQSMVSQWQDAIDNYDKHAAALAEAVAAFGKAMKGVNQLFKPSQISSFDWEDAARNAEKEEENK